MVVGSLPVVVGAVVVGSVPGVVVGVVVVGAAVTGGWVVAPKVESASVIVVVPAVAGAWAVAAPEVVVGRLTASGPVSEVGGDEVGKVVGSWGPVVGVDTVTSGHPPTSLTCAAT